MYRSLFMAFLFCLTSSIANAQGYQSSKPVICDSFSEVFTTIINDFNEKLFWAGEDLTNESKYALMVNSETGTWTIIQFSKDTACVLGVGKNSSLSTGKQL